MQTRGKTAITLCFPLVLLTICPYAFAETIYVNANATGANDGTSWTDAYRELVPALARAGAGDEIWVAAGTYTPDYDPISGTHTAGRTASFILKSDVAIYGGFAGGESALDERDWNTNLAVLSGDLLGDDDGDGKTDNSYHVLALASGLGSATLDGLTISGGYANGLAGVDDRGGGIRILSASGISRNCTWRDNFARMAGGAVYSSTSGSLNVEMCLFDGNTVDSGSTALPSGGAIYSTYTALTINRSTFRANANRSLRVPEYMSAGGAVYASRAAVTIADCTFEDNYCGGGGGAVYSGYGSWPTVIRCVFERNVSDLQGGAVGIGTYNPAVVRDCIFRDNSSPTQDSDGGGGFLHDRGFLVIANCEFIGNSSNKGGGLRTHFDTVQVVNCRFRDNSTTVWGGGVYNRGSTVTMVNCVVADNQSMGPGGGIANSDSNLTLVNSTIVGNSTYNGAGGIDAFVSTTPPDMGLAVSNCIIWGNSGPQGTGEDSQLAVTGQPLIVNRSCVQGWTGVLGGTGNFGLDPLFVAGDAWRHLQASSPCIDAGDSSLLPSDFADLDDDGNTSEPTPLDFEGHPRRVDDPHVVDTGAGGAPVVDMGAHEYAEDCDANGLFDVCDLSCDAAGGACNMAGCGLAGDCNANAVPDDCETDSEGDGTIDDCDADDDNDGILDDGDGSGTAGDHPCVSGQTSGCDDNCRTAANPDQDETDGDSVGDACDQCPRTIPGVAVDAAGCPPLVAADLDRDGDVDQQDFGILQGCLSGFSVPQTDPGCDACHLDEDGDVDKLDVGLFLGCLSGPDIPSDPNCMP